MAFGNHLVAQSQRSSLRVKSNVAASTVSSMVGKMHLPYRREIRTENFRAMPITTVFISCHSQFVAIVHLRNATQGEQQSESLTITMMQMVRLFETGGQSADVMALRKVSKLSGFASFILTDDRKSRRCTVPLVGFSSAHCFKFMGEFHNAGQL